MGTYDRYSQFRINGETEIVPFVKIREKSTDFFETYKKNESRLDLLSYAYYKDANYGWLILMANPEAGSMEYEIPDGTELRIPYPLGETIQDYRDAVEQYKKLTGK